MTLDEIARRQGTDKRRGQHGYTPYYERLLSTRSIRSMLEIGVARGASLRMWSEYLPSARIFGIDTYPGSKDAKVGRGEVHLIDQKDREALAAFSIEHGPFDFIVDDAGHRTSHQIVSFESLWPFVAPGGLYVIEDAFATFNTDSGEADLGPGKLYDYFFDLLVRRFALHSSHCDASRNDFDTIEFSTGMIAIGKAA